LLITGDATRSLGGKDTIGATGREAEAGCISVPTWPWPLWQLQELLIAPPTEQTAALQGSDGTLNRVEFGVLYRLISLGLHLSEQFPVEHSPEVDADACSPCLQLKQLQRMSTCFEIRLATAARSQA